MKINEAVAKRVEQLLEKQSRTQYAVAKEGGISNSTFSPPYRADAGVA